MKKILLFLCIFGIITACGKAESPVTGMNTTLFDSEKFSMHIPENWTATGKTDISLHTWIPVLSAISPEKKYNFSPNIVVLLDELKFLWTSTQYSEQNYAKTEKTYLEHTQQSHGHLIFPDSDESKYFIFDAKYNAQTPKMRFIQTAKVCGTQVYLLHASIDLHAKPDIFLDLFRTFQCK